MRKNASEERVLVWSDPELPVRRSMLFEVFSTVALYDISCVVLAGHIVQPNQERYANVFLIQLAHYMDQVPGGGKVEIIPSFSLPEFNQDVRDLIESGMLSIRPNGRLYEVASPVFKPEWVFLAQPTRKQIEEELREGIQVAYVGAAFPMNWVGVISLEPGLYLFQRGKDPIVMLPELQEEKRKELVSAIETMSTVEAVRRLAAFFQQTTATWTALKGVTP